VDHKELTLQTEKDKKNTISAVSNENKKWGGKWEIAPEKFQEKKMRNKGLVKFTYFGKHFKILTVVFRNTKTRITSGPGVGLI
jgi:hypothetical protein